VPELHGARTLAHPARAGARVSAQQLTGSSS
jgi:hypothetical protein